MTALTDAYTTDPVGRDSSLKLSSVEDAALLLEELRQWTESAPGEGYRLADYLSAAAVQAPRARALPSVTGLAIALVQPTTFRLLGKPRQIRDLLTLAANPAAFDVRWYLGRYPDVAGQPLDPLLHYILFGAREGRWPNPAFDGGWYLDAYPDVAASGVNPLAHFLRQGRREQRLPNNAAAASQAWIRGMAARTSDLLPRLEQLVPSAPQTVVAAPWSPPPLPAVSSRGRRILFVKNNSDHMTHHYRIANYMEALPDWGFECVVESFTNQEALERIEADILVMCRIVSGPSAFALIDRFRAAGRPVIFDIDDLVFAPEKINLMRQIEFWCEEDKQRTRDYVHRNLETMLRCDFTTCSTFALKAEVEARGVRAFVVPNNIGRRTYAAAAAVREERASRAGRSRTRFAYFSGTNTHEHDFEAVKGALHSILRARSDVEFLAMGELAAASEFDHYGDQFVRVPLAPHDQMLQVLASVDVNLAPLELDNAFTNAKSELKIFEAALYGIPTIASATSSYASVIEHGLNGVLARSEFEWLDAMTRLADDPALRQRLGAQAADTIAVRFDVDQTVQEMAAVYNAALSGRIRSSSALARGVVLPKVTVVAILYNKAKEVGFFLESLRRQSYEGEYEVVLVDDRSPDDSVQAVARFQRWRLPQADSNPHMRVRILSNAVNLGNCGSRNAGIAQSDGDIIVVVDADCMLNRDFLAEHVAAYLKGDADAVFGPMNIETGDRPALSVLNCFEPDPAAAAAAADMQDGVNLESFVNTITRNFSIRRSYLDETLGGVLFDELFSYSAAPDSGFGWEDVEMGCRLYKAGARLKFVSATASIHVSHPDSVDRPDKAMRSLRNFRRLHDKHPEISLLARQWGVRTYGAIVQWARGSGAELDDHPDFTVLQDIYGRYQRAPVIIDRHRKLRVLTYRWHVPHQYELYKTGHAFTLATQSGSRVCDDWDWSQRPLPSNARLEPMSQIDPRDYDLAILHFDENALRPDLMETPDEPEYETLLLSPDWGASFMAALQWDLPKIAICHGTPQFALAPDGAAITSESNVARIRRLCGDMTVVCNAYQAQQDWGFARSEVIWHGFSPHEYPLGSRDRGVVTMPKRAMMNRPVYNGWNVARKVAALSPETSIAFLRTPDPEPAYTERTAEWATAKFQNYVREVGAHSVYFNPTERSPMPRSRGEAMMAGLASVSLRNYDVDLFIRNGENGFYGESPEELADQLRFLARNPEACERIGLAGRRTALDIFNQDRYLSSWSKLINKVVSD